MRTWWLAMAMATCGTASPRPGPDPAPTPAPAVPAVPAVPALVTATVCIHCTGPLAGDAEGRAIASIYLTIDAAAALTGLRLVDLELTDDHGAIVTRGSPREYLGRVSEPPSRDLGRFDGRVGAGARVGVWTTAQLDALDERLRARPPTRYRLRLVADGGATLELAGAMATAGATG